MLLVSVLGLICSFVPATGIGQASSIIERAISHRLPSLDRYPLLFTQLLAAGFGFVVLKADSDVIDVEVQPSLTIRSTMQSLERTMLNRGNFLAKINHAEAHPLADETGFLTLGNPPWSMGTRLDWFILGDRLIFPAMRLGSWCPEMHSKCAAYGQLLRREKHWQRPAHAVCENREVFQGGRGKVHGNLTRAGAQKSLRILREEKQENNFFEENTKAEFAQIILRNGNSAGNGTHITTLFCTAFCQRIAAPIRRRNVFINGEYWGFVTFAIVVRTLRALTGDTSRFELLDENAVFTRAHTHPQIAIYHLS